MPLTKEIRIQIQEILESDLSERADELLNWLYGDKKQVVLEILDLLTLYQDLDVNQTRELVDLRKEQNEPVQKFFPMSTTARKRY